MGTLTGKTALVTGASRGIGRATAERLAREGARVGVHYGTAEGAANETVRAIEAAGGAAFAFGTEFGRPGDAQTFWAAFDQHADGLDILVNNAGVVMSGGIGEVGEDDFDALFAIDVKAVFFVTRHALPRLRDGGRIINVSTGAAYIAVPSVTAYAMAKGAINVLTRTMAWDRAVASRGITVNAVAPGFVRTDATAWLDDPGAAAWAESQSAARRISEPEDIADVIAFLASDGARTINGQVVDATAGSVLGVTAAG